MLEKIPTGPQLLLSLRESFLNAGFTSAYFKCSGKNDARIMSLKFAQRSFKNMSQFFLIIFVGMSHFCVAFVGSKLFS